MNHPILTTSGAFVCHCVRLHRGDDLLLSIRELAQEKHIAAGVVLSAVGCVTEAKVRDASGVNIRSIGEHCEIVSLNGTVSEQRCHLTSPCPEKTFPHWAVISAPAASSTPPVSW